MTRRILALAAKDLRDIIRERTIILALVTQCFVAAFSAFLTFGLIGLYDPESIQGFPSADVAYVGPGGFDAHLERADNLDVERMEAAAARAAFHRGDVAFVVEELRLEEDGVRVVTLLLAEGDVRTTLHVTQLKALLRQYERELREEREDRLEQDLVFVSTGAEPAVFYAFALGILLPLLVATPVFLSGAITADAFAQEVNTRTLHLLRASPLGTGELVAGKLLTPVLLAPAQVALWILLLAANGLPIHNVGPILAATTVWTLLLAAAGLAVAVLVPREGQAQAAYTLVVLVLALLLLALPQDPLNLVARLGAGNPDTATWTTLGLTGLAAAGATLAAWAALARRFRRVGA